MNFNPKEIRIDCTEDRPKSGMKVSNYPCWVTITHLPSMMVARCYGSNQWRARSLAMDALEHMVLNSREDDMRCGHPEVIR